MRPKNGRNWSEKECETLRTILAKYTMVQIAVVLNSVRSNDYRDLIKVCFVGFVIYLDGYSTKLKRKEEVRGGVRSALRQKKIVLYGFR